MSVEKQCKMIGFQISFADATDLQNHKCFKLENDKGKAKPEVEMYAEKFGSLPLFFADAFSLLNQTKLLK